MKTNAFQKRFTQLQARLSQQLSYLLADSYDTMAYDSHIHRLLAESGIDYQTYTILPWVDYCNSHLALWTVFVMQQHEWVSVQLPNPFYQSPCISKFRHNSQLTPSAEA
ncbi:hypothetical protein H6G89_15895 [Oscillatoria sp. FACHB-1407]|uniref:hypothetical protein n=1 Tax=Oscillatoria sp. FACHB-1407 TaxID=2692847 RepID=UPI0016831E3B|nr:hypothetical protein [Oscillatoria sp. FACHB-1407]MBD2462528.1 hypothetical protein [Oscillatoria sp. FACHB-1407]